MNKKTHFISTSIVKEINNSDNVSILELDQEEIISLFKANGILLFRGFDVDVDIFKEFTNLLSIDFINYAGGAFSRRVINGDETLLSVNDFKSEIKLHGEMYYQKNIPLMLWFFCANPPLEDGETTVCDGRQFFNEISSSTKELFSKKKLKFNVRISQEDWQKKYQTDDLNQLEEMCRKNNTHLTVNEDQSILLEYISPAIIPSRCGKYKVFINSLLPTKQLNPKILNFEDDSEIPEEVVSEMNEIAEKITTEISWQKGDILMIDNTRILHGRRSFADDQKDIYIRLCSPAFSF
ncbi:TauD/TfdA family dioxygenase [Nostoc sp. UCD121]|uniref:TauD/TfdA family dioxygenase n=1 Tax=unclassified Nostoc TaxID=2593658 RepID=UPI001624850B|nr:MULTISPECIES: TauD/TfdA family dioxygenase [unclassified Nostoc]MBC1223968.1 TauD/TfdA family dioxygenase [Nostoc sp. UCD120]MBC1279456.1 TauD/TfdA family dioxygenase [Nostoc sp. UCD121]MBC1298375.1 TauD/TfdA family dioxygenase [Nostoc sp. UCD122]